MYTSVASMLVESAAPYSVFGIMFLIPYAMGNPIAISFGQVWAKIAVCPFVNFQFMCMVLTGLLHSAWPLS
jgi:hypothetical protein